MVSVLATLHFSFPQNLKEGNIPFSGNLHSAQSRYLLSALGARSGDTLLCLRVNLKEAWRPPTVSLCLLDQVTIIMFKVRERKPKWLKFQRGTQSPLLDAWAGQSSLGTWTEDKGGSDLSTGTLARLPDCRCYGTDEPPPAPGFSGLNLTMS